eukprot:gb/GEZN01011135.1/.p1 GENE.gb/GEZN01011135.1/~~gb/GEZN01011135.1/.p1  ORF type:complete len:310 (-),score=45.60 gb/GEZN01011135.1/:173-1102(-)
MSAVCSVICCGVCAGVGIIAMAISFSTLHSTEWGLDYSGVTLRIAREPKTGGLHLLGPGHSFLRFPNTYQNMQFSTGEHDLLHTRTSDGLPLTLGISFQYTLMEGHLYDLYMLYKMDYETVLFNVATHTIANTACRYSAYNFFNDKQSIAYAMQAELNNATQAQLYLMTETFQITLVELPASFEDAILESISMKQNITRTQKYEQNMQVNFETQIMAASQSANQTITLAMGQAQKILSQSLATAQSLNQTIEAEISSYKKIKEALGLNSEQLLEYIWWDGMTDSQSHSQFVVDMSSPGMLLSNMRGING